jgi:hypothetical protein
MSDAPVGSDPADEGSPPEPSGGAPTAGLIELRRALVGLGQVWATAVSGFGSVLAATYGLAGSPVYLLASVAAAAVAVFAGRAALRTFGYR